ncbi:MULTISPECIES: cytochrome c maturation protein CcmE domain-containing protein [Hymenobacter]|uniref:Cytochrome c maturation protein CcmE n=1 Tax=Hymenobacter guriensis TaxID=2793065 RepID=A0ABS0L4C6_9BACT|nr:MULTISPECIES: cytochrome c maturation protein CcmE [Hymenobacter]MBG8554264.1 cytochrome c maturation protein CcmE [Hymenobacter guriensis]MCR5887410.1 cytochrome c maturation protein CcmE [Hymenobacter sp. J193]
MKKSHLLILAVIAVAISILVTTAGDVSQYVSFKEARELAAEGNAAKVHVVGRLPRDPQKNIMGLEYNPTLDPNYFAFTLVDTNRLAQRVVYFNPKPQDFDKSEQVVITGSMRNDVFVADKILLKCPSKYVEKDIKGATAMR